MFRLFSACILLMAALYTPTACDNDTSTAATIPGDIPPLVDSSPVTVERTNQTPGPDDAGVREFTREFTAFFRDTGYFSWLSRYSQGLPENNQWGLPGYKVWWTNAFASRHGDTVTITWKTPSDNSTAKVSRALAPAAGLLLASGDPTVYDIVLGYIRGLSANYDGMVWGNEDPVVDTLMARCIFNRSYQTELDGGRKIAVDYDSVRYEVIERRHDTLHNPDNPTWGDIYVRNKRSKDDFPYLYRDVPWLIRLIWQTDDDTLRQASIKLLRQVRAMARDIVDHGYTIRTKDGDGAAFTPETEGGDVEDFASFTSYDFLFPLAECDAKMSTAYLATGGRLDNECISDDVAFYGDGGGYEAATIASHFWGSNMIWGYHVTALAVSLAFGDNDTAAKLLEGMATRMDGLMQDERADKYTEWWPDVAQLLVQAAAYGLPLTGDEATLIQRQYREAAAFYRQSVVWDPWDASAPEDTPFPVLPDRNTYNDQDEVAKTHVRITEILNPFEYCASPLRATTGAQFVDCDTLLNPGAWSTESR